MRRQIHGILLLDKPEDMTSNGALQRVKRLFNAKKAGHTGSLDPIATGMLPLCFGEATKFSQFLLESDKSYQVVAQLGVCTTTGDCEGEVTATHPVQVTLQQIEIAMQKFVGEIEQIPPMYSAIKYQGKPLYDLARRGIEVARQPRKIKIFSLQLDEVIGTQVTFRVHCSKGTYVRTLVEDIGKALDCGAHVTALRRTTVTPYHGAVMYTLPALEAISERLGFTGLSSCLLPVETAVQSFPAVTLSTPAAFYLRTGQAVRTSLSVPVGSLIRLLSEQANFIGIGEMTVDGRIKPHRLLAAS